MELTAHERHLIIVALASEAKECRGLAARMREPANTHMFNALLAGAAACEALSLKVDGLQEPEQC